MAELCVFAGTTEGRKIAEFLALQSGVDVSVCVATEYAAELMKYTDRMHLYIGRMDGEQMETLLSERRFDLVIDATHPYAEIVTDNIALACEKTETEYLRVLRDNSEKSDDIFVFKDTASCVEYLDRESGNVLLTTGSKEVKAFSSLNGFSDRVFVRVLPTSESIEKCIEAGIVPSHIIAMQGPFGREMNRAVLSFAKARFMVTKDGGAQGGFEEKIAAAKENNVRVLVIGRPEQRKGLSFESTMDYLLKKYVTEYCCRVDIVGVGPGTEQMMTAAALKSISDADCLIGAPRLVKNVSVTGKGAFEAISPETIADYICTHTEYRHFSVLMSGDTGFFSGAKKLEPLLSGKNVNVIPGISSLSYFCAKTGTSYEDMCVVSMHGRTEDIARKVRTERKVFVLTGGQNDPNEICRILTEAGLGSCTAHVGERLGYEDEMITSASVAELSGHCFNSLAVMLVENDHPDTRMKVGMQDDSFVRGKGQTVVPMTKSEVRAVCMSKLQIQEDSVCWDIGAGTGSVSVEMAFAAKNGRVYSVEQKTEAQELITANAETFGLKNLVLVRGTAPEVCGELPEPTHVFIGGTSGKLSEIISYCIGRNPRVRIVVTAVTMETCAEMTEWFQNEKTVCVEAVGVSVTKIRQAGNSHLMNAVNPVWIYTLQAGESKE